MENDYIRALRREMRGTAARRSGRVALIVEELRKAGANMADIRITGERKTSDSPETAPRRGPGRPKKSAE